MVADQLDNGQFWLWYGGLFPVAADKRSDEYSSRLHAGAIRMGTTLLALAIGVLVLAGIAHWFTLRQATLGKTPVLTQWPLSITVAMLVAIGLIGLWALYSQ